MTKGFKFYLIFAFLLAICFYVLNLADTMEHEHLHAGIFEDYGLDVQEVKVYYNPIKASLEGHAGYTQVIAKEYVEKCNETCKALHTQVELASYQNNTIRGTMFILIFFIILIISLLLPEED